MSLLCGHLPQVPGRCAVCRAFGDSGAGRFPGHPAWRVRLLLMTKGREGYWHHLPQEAFLGQHSSSRRSSSPVGSCLGLPAPPQPRAPLGPLPRPSPGSPLRPKAWSSLTLCPCCRPEPVTCSVGLRPRGPAPAPVIKTGPGLPISDQRSVMTLLPLETTGENKAPSAPCEAPGSTPFTARCGPPPCPLGLGRVGAGGGR